MSKVAKAKSKISDPSQKYQIQVKISNPSKTYQIQGKVIKSENRRLTAI
jgi:hypothetical protein